MRAIDFRARLSRIPRLEPGVLLIIVFAMAAFVMAQLYDPDYFWHLRTGQLILDTHTIPRHDPFSFTRPDAPWLVNAWLFDVLLYSVHSIGGSIGVRLFDDVVDLDQPFPHGLVRDRAVEADVLARHLEQRQHAAAVLLVNLDHLRLPLGTPLRPGRPAAPVHRRPAEQRRLVSFGGIGRWGPARAEPCERDGTGRRSPDKSTSSEKLLHNLGSRFGWWLCHLGPVSHELRSAIANLAYDFGGHNDQVVAALPGSIQREEKAVAADVRRRISIRNRVPPPHVGGYDLFCACLNRPR